MTLDSLIERAAIREYCGGMSRDEAEALTASDYGFKTWDEAVSVLTFLDGDANVNA